MYTNYTTSCSAGTLNYSVASGPLNPYPVHAFPQKIANLIGEQHRNNEAPLSLIGSSVLGAMSGAIQDKVDVETLSGSFVPPIVWTLSVSASGSRKSTVDEMISRFFGVFEGQVSSTLKSAIATQMAKRVGWEAQMELVGKKMKSESESGKIIELQSELAKLFQEEPLLINIPRILYQDATPEALYKGLMKWPSGMVSSSESGALFSSRTFNNLPQFNRLWDGKENHRIDRVSSESFVVENPRLTISLMVQPKTFLQFLDGKGRLARDSGFLARFLICQPENLAGTRYGYHHTGSWVHHEDFQTRMLDILFGGVTPLGKPVERKKLKLSKDAYAVLKQFANLVETNLGFGQYLCDVPDAASKLAENASRMAALFHYYQDEGEEISAEIMRRATEICGWYMDEFKRLFAEKIVMPLEFQDADAIELCLRRFSDTNPGMNVLKKYLFTHGPNAVRSKARLDLALYVLSQRGRVDVQKINNKFIVLLNPQYFPAVNQVPYQNGYVMQNFMPRVDRY